MAKPSDRSIGPLPLPKVTRAAVERLDALTQGLAAVCAPLSRALGEVLREPVELVGAPHSACDARDERLCVQLVSDDVRARVWVDEALARVAVDRVLDRRDTVAPERLSEAECGVFAYVVLVALRAVASRFRLVDATLHRQPAGGCEIAVRAFGLAWEIGVDWPHHDGCHETVAGRSLLANAPQTLVVVCGRTRMLARDLAALNIGDVIIFDSFADIRRASAVTLCVGRLRADALFEGQQLCVRCAWVIGMETPREALQVELIAEAGRLTLTGREVLALQPGSVLELGRPVGAPIDVTVGGRVVARAELVDIEGEVGLRITEILP